jgi:osmotically-inducible protein OsmY
MRQSQNQGSRQNQRPQNQNSGNNNQYREQSGSYQSDDTQRSGGQENEFNTQEPNEFPYRSDARAGQSDEPRAEMSRQQTQRNDPYSRSGGHANFRSGSGGHRDGEYRNTYGGIGYQGEYRNEYRNDSRNSEDRGAGYGRAHYNETQFNDYPNEQFRTSGRRDSYTGESFSGGYEPAAWMGNRPVRDMDRDTSRNWNRDLNTTGNGYANNWNSENWADYGSGQETGPDNRYRSAYSNSNKMNTSQSGTSHRGKGPKGYTRSDDRVREEVSDALEQDHWIDASEIEVDVKDGIVTLSGHVDSRKMKRLAEDCVSDLRGVKDVINTIQVQGMTSTQSSRTASAHGSTSDSARSDGSAAAANQKGEQGDESRSSASKGRRMM